MFRTSKILKSLALALVVAGAALLTTGTAYADKLHLKDGRVLDGKVVREGKGFIFFKVKVGSVESEQLFTEDQISKIDRDDPKPKTDENIKKDEDAKKTDAKADEAKHTGATRVCILNFGPPSDWQGTVENMVGREISVAAFRKVVPLLEKAKVDVVVIRINSGGGLSLEMPRFQDLFEKEYKPKFRTVAWIESAISAAAMSPWTIEEYYFLPQGNMGACTEFNMGNMKASTGIKLEEVLLRMEKASAWGKKDPRIMRAMEIQEPLSVDVDENGEVHWRQDEQGQVVLNPKGQVFTINANDAVKYKFAKGIAANKDELVKKMGLQEVEWVAQDATDMIDRSLRDNDAAYKRFDELLKKYQLAIGVAEQAPDKERRGIQLGIAKRLLAELKQKLALNPNFPMFLGIPDEWFGEQEELIRKLAQQP
jgi:hypothetical protein